MPPKFWTMRYLELLFRKTLLFTVNNIIVTCNEFTMVKIHATAADSLLKTNNSPMIQVHPSNGKSAKVLHNRVLQKTQIMKSIVRIQEY